MAGLDKKKIGSILGAMSLLPVIISIIISILKEVQMLIFISLLTVLVF